MKNKPSLNIKIEKDLAIITLNQINILSQNLREKMRSCIDQVIKNPSVHVAILLFKNNSQELLNIKEIEKIHGREKWERLLDEIHSLFHLMETANVSWIAGLHGACIGNQLELSLICDYRITDLSKNTILGFPELSFGLIPSFGGCIRLPYLIGIKKSLEMILNSQLISSREAYRIGLVSEVSHPLDLEKHTRKLAEQIIKGNIPPKPLRKYKPLRFLDKFFEISAIRYILYYLTKKRILSQTRGFYPAALKALEVIRNTYMEKSLKTALKEESDAFCDLISSSTTKHLMSLHLIKEGMKNKEPLSDFSSTNISSSNAEAITSTKISVKKVKKAAVMGAGTMGREITHWLANHHVPVLLKDIHHPSLSSSLRYIDSKWNEQIKSHQWLSLFIKKKKEADLHSRQLQNLWKKPLVENLLYDHNTFTTFEKKLRFSKLRPQVDYSGFHNVDIVIEAVVEDLEIKKKTIAETASHLSDTCLFATNTSSLSITELAKSHPNPSRFFGLHFFYPAHHTPLVEIIKGKQSSDAALASVFYWIRQMGKIPFIIKDSPGFLVHRLFLPLMSEALWLLEEGAGVQQIDQIYSSFGFSMGPFRLMDELGLDICLKLIKSFQSTGLSLDLPERISKLRSSFLGKKNKIGFYIYNNKMQVESVNNLIYQDLKLKPSSKKFSRLECLERGLYRMVNEAAQVLEEQVISTAEQLDLALIIGIGFPAFRGGLLKYADETSLKTIIASLNNFSNKWGKRFQPTSFLVKQAETGKPFYNHR